MSQVRCVALRLCQSDGMELWVSQLARLTGAKNGDTRRVVAMSVGQVDRPTAAAKLSAHIH